MTFSGKVIGMQCSTCLCAVLLLVLLVPAVGSGDPFPVSVAAGYGWVNSGLTEGPPGAEFELDYAALDPMVASPLDVGSVVLAFDTVGVIWTHLVIQLDADPAALQSFPTLNGQQVSHLVYDPALVSDPGPGPATVMDPVWKAELSDGVLSGRLWVEGVSAGVPTGFGISALTMFLVPEPGSLAVLVLGAAAALRRRPRR